MLSLFICIHLLLNICLNFTNIIIITISSPNRISGVPNCLIIGCNNVAFHGHCIHSPPGISMNPPIPVSIPVAASPQMVISIYFLDLAIQWEDIPVNYGLICVILIK